MAGLTQDEVADHFGIKRASVAQWEGKRSKPSMEKIIDLARLLHTTPDWLIDENGEPPVKRDKDQDRLPSPEREPITPELAEEYLDRLRKADPKVRESVLTLLGLRPHP